MAHDSDVTPNRYVFINSICVGWPLNVGIIIPEYMKSVVESPKTRWLPYGSVIHDMCRNTGVVIGTSKPVSVVERAIYRCCVENLVIWKGGEEHDSGLGWFNYQENFQPLPLPKNACDNDASFSAATTAPQVTQPILVYVFNKQCKLGIGAQVAEL